MADHWKSIANLLGAPGVDEPEEHELPTAASEMEQAPAEESSAPQSESDESDSLSAPAFGQIAAERDDRPQKDEAQEPEVIQAVTPKPSPAKKSQESTTASKPKKKSSWETLANMFNVSLDRSVEPDQGETDQVPQASEDTHEAPQSASSTELSIFGADENDGSNPALNEMFGDVPRAKPDEWSANRRMIDDVGWDDDAEPVANVDEELSIPEPTTSSDEEENDEFRRRGRRRRRGRGRSSSDDNRRSITDNDDEPEVEAKSEDWSEPRGPEADVEDLSDDKVERRSSRRRRRGRTRGFEEESKSELVESDDSRRVDNDDEFEASSSEKTSRAEREGGRRRRRKRPAEPQADRKEIDATADGGSDEMDEEQADGPKHRNIPTWIDALQPMIDANTENHRRGDNRGGPRGRSRTRR